MIEYPFIRRETEDFGEVRDPTIPVTISGPDRDLKVFMLVDSGADISLIPYSVGERIGLDFDIRKRREVRGIGEGALVYIPSTVSLEIAGVEAPVRVGWTLLEETPLVLGRLDVFRRFDIEFKELANKVIFKDATPLPDP